LKQKDKILLRLQQIIEGVDNKEKIEKIDNYLFSTYKPKSFFGKTSEEIKYDKHFECCCLFISRETHADAKKMTVLQFYNALDMIKKDIEAKQKAYKRIKK
jgi:hypothetical protein